MRKELLLYVLSCAFLVSAMEQHRTHKKKHKQKKSAQITQTISDEYEKKKTVPQEVMLGVLEHKKDELKNRSFKNSEEETVFLYKEMLGKDFVKAIPDHPSSLTYLKNLAISLDGNYVAWPRSRGNGCAVAYMHKDHEAVHEPDLVTSETLPHLFFTNKNLLLALVNTNPTDYYLSYDNKHIELFIIDVADQSVLKNISLTKVHELCGCCFVAAFDPHAQRLVLKLYNRVVTIHVSQDATHVEQIFELHINDLGSRVICFNNTGTTCAFRLPGGSEIALWQPAVKRKGFPRVGNRLTEHSADMMFDPVTDYLIVVSSYKKSVTVWDVSKLEQPKLLHVLSDPLCASGNFTVISGNKLVQVGTSLLDRTDKERSHVRIWDYTGIKKRLVGQIDRSLWQAHVETIHSDVQDTVYICLDNGTILICRFE